MKALTMAITYRRRLFLSLRLITCLLGRFFLIEGFLVGRHWISTRSCALARKQVCGASAVYSAPDSPQPRKRQIRQKSVHRRPPRYWSNLENVHDELTLFWQCLKVTLPTNEPPPIPNERLLNHFDRHDLRYAIVSHGGREAMSDRLGGARIMPGKWATAVQTSPELRQLLTNATHGLSPHMPPLSPQQKKQLAAEVDISMRNQTRWKHGEHRKPKGYWTIGLVIQELYQYLDNFQEEKNRPSVWMPRPQELSSMGRDDLRQAILRAGGSTEICKLAGLVPFREWHYFEGQYELLVELRRYLDLYHDGNRTYFPPASDMKRHGHTQLHSLVQFYGGLKFLANRLSMSSANAPRHYADLNWGPFSIDTAIDLYRYVRADQMKKKGPLMRPVIAIPSQRKLLADGQERLHQNIMELGGYESVARRLGLDFSG